MHIKKFFSIILIVLPLSLWSDDFSGWKKLSTEHYTFIFEEYDETTAFELADYSEEIYEKVTDFFDFYPKRIHVYINSRIDRPNGMFYPIPGSITLYPVYPLNSENSTKSESWLFELLLHETVHFVQLKKRRGLFGGLSYIFGMDLAAANGAFLPAWMVEGIAVYLETEFTKGGRGRNKYFEALTKAAAVEKKYFNIYQLAYSSDFPPYNRIYSGGYILVKHLIENFGEDIIQNIYNRYIRFPFFGPFHAIKMETGKSIKEIFEDLKASEQRKYALQPHILDSYRSEKISTGNYGDWTHPVLTEKGILIYRTDQEKNSAILLVDVQTGEEEIIVETNLMDGSSFCADSSGENIVFASGDSSLYHMYGFSLSSNLYLHNQGSTTLISKDQSLFHPAISPDGDSIIAVQRTGSYSKLVSVNKITGQTTDIFVKDQTNIMNPVFSPTSEMIAFVLNDHGFQDIYTMKLSEPDSVKPLYSKDLPSEYFPRFIDENRLSYVSDREDDLSLFLYNIQTGRTELIFKDPVGIADGFISGETVFYSSYRIRGYELRKGVVKESGDYSLSVSSVPPSPFPINTYETQYYFDWARPYLWLPKPYINISASEGVQWGVGAAIFAGSYAQSSQWTFELNYLPGLGQLSGYIDYSRKIGTSSINYSVVQTYEELSQNSQYYWGQKTEQTAGLVFPLFEKNRLNWRNVLQTFISVRHSLQFYELDSFSLAESFSGKAYNFLYTGGGLALNNYRINYPRKSLFGDFRLFNQLEISILLPLLSSESTSFAIKESGSLTLPLGPESFLLKTGWEGAYHNRGLSSSVISARGWSPSSVDSDFSLYYSLDYLMPIALVDWGLPLGFNIQNIAAAIHLEGISNFLLDDYGSNELYGGIEFIGTYGYNYGKIPAGAGINFRFYNKGKKFDPAEDIKVYFFLSFNSLN
ncbi:MAG: hypothetical protein JEY91_02840 [Spirochaetaceae bacterium]|nr:hypothetical protein [Spirochaetaceae bacterium]